MKKIIYGLLIALIATFCLSINNVQAQSAYESFTKDYCNQINATPTTYNNDSYVSLAKVNSSGTVTGVNINKITVSGSAGAQTFNVNQTLMPTSIAGGAKVLVPGLDSFIKQNTAGGSYTVNIDKTIQYSDGDPNDAGGKITPKDYSCSTQVANAIQVSSQSKAQQAAAPRAAAAQPANLPPELTVGCGGGNSIATAIGCIPYDDPAAFVGFFLKWFVGISGGIAFLLIIWSGIQMMNAQGDPSKLNAGREVLTGAISGLIFIIFSVFLLNLIGYQILRIPGF
jgi:hypothetical protein